MIKLCRTAFLMLALAGSAHAQVLVQYDPTGAQGSPTPLVAAVVSPDVTASNLVQTMPEVWGNTDVWPVPVPGVFDTARYTSFTITPRIGSRLNLTALNYSVSSYFDSSITLSLRSSLDGFAADIDTASSTFNGPRTWQANFDLSSLPRPLTGPIEFRIFPDNTGAADFADVVSTSAGGNGLVLLGADVRQIPANDSIGIALLLAGLMLTAWFVLRRQHA